MSNGMTATNGTNSKILDRNFILLEQKSADFYISIRIWISYWIPQPKRDRYLARLKHNDAGIFQGRLLTMISHDNRHSRKTLER